MKEKHGQYKTRLYNIWSGMKDRCRNKNNSSYYLYGERGIKVCEEWNNSFIAFKNWSDINGYQDNLQIDRIDNSKGYSPSNCRWVTPKENSNNTRKNVHVEYNGKIYSTEDMANELGCDKRLINLRMSRGWSAERIMTTPVTTAARYLYNGEELTISELAIKLGCTYTAIYKKLRKGKNIQDVIRYYEERNEQNG